MLPHMTKYSIVLLFWSTSTKKCWDGRLMWQGQDESRRFGRHSTMGQQGRGVRAESAHTPAFSFKKSVAPNALFVKKWLLTPKKVTLNHKSDFWPKKWLFDLIHPLKTIFSNFCSFHAGFVYISWPFKKNEEYFGPGLGRWKEWTYDLLYKK